MAVSRNCEQIAQRMGRKESPNPGGKGGGAGDVYRDAAREIKMVGHYCREPQTWGHGVSTSSPLLGGLEGRKRRIQGVLIKQRYEEEGLLKIPSSAWTLQNDILKRWQ